MTGNTGSLVLRHPKTYIPKGSRATLMCAHNTQVNWHSNLPASLKFFDNCLGGTLDSALQFSPRDPLKAACSTSPLLASHLSQGRSFPNEKLQQGVRDCFWPSGENEEEAGRVKGRLVWKPYLCYWPQMVATEDFFWGSLFCTTTNLGISYCFQNNLSQNLQDNPLWELLFSFCR